MKGGNSAKELYQQLRVLPWDQLWNGEVARFDRAPPRERFERVAVIRAVGAVFPESGPPGQRNEVLAWLRKLLRDPEEKVRRYAMAALPKIGAGASEEAELLALLRAGAGEREANYLGRTLDKIGGEATLEALETPGILTTQTEQKVRASLARSRESSSIALDREIPDPADLRIHLRGRKGLEEIVRQEVEERGTFRVVAVGPGLVAIRAPGPFTLADVFAHRCFGTAGFVLGTCAFRGAGVLPAVGGHPGKRGETSVDPQRNSFGFAGSESRETFGDRPDDALSRKTLTSFSTDAPSQETLTSFSTTSSSSGAGKGQAEPAEELASVMTSPLSRRLLGALTRGPIRYRLEFAGKGHQRGKVRAVVNRAYALCPEILNDSRQAPWAIDVHPAEGGESVELRPRLSPDPRWAYRLGDVPAASHPPLAACMARLACPWENEVVWDPFCGSGLELVERALRGGVSRVYGTDCSAEAIEIARQNFAAAPLGPVEASLTCCDFRDFAGIEKLPPRSLTLILTNPPLGRRVPIRNLRGLFDDLFAAAATLLAPGGRLVLTNPFPMESPPPGLQLATRRIVDMGGFTCRLELYRRLQQVESAPRRHPGRRPSTRAHRRA